MEVLVLQGGNSPERAVSLRSAAAVTTALQTAGYEVYNADPAEGYDCLDGLEDTIVLPILHGVNCEDGVIQAELEKRNLPYLGCTSSVSAVCFDKSRTRQVYQQAGLPIAKGDTVTAETYAANPLAKQPHVLKVTTGGSSIGTLLVPNPASVDRSKVDEVFQLGKEAVIEELVNGVEITVPVLDQEALPVIEIQPPQGKEFDYENKYNGATTEICPPVSIDAPAQNRAQDLAVRAHRALDCRHLSRTDMIVKPDGEIVLLETNTIPGLTNQSLLPVAAKAAGLDMPALVTRFVEMVARDYQLGDV